VGDRGAIPQVIVVADAGPLLHLHWVGATTWALPPMPVHVVDAVWSEVYDHDPAALTDTRLMRVGSPHPKSAPGLAGLDAGEAAAITYALAQQEPLILCDDLAARRVCTRLGVSVTGTIGLIVEAARGGHTSIESATAALTMLPTMGRMYVSAELIRSAVDALRPV
jgi:hypothetical protein